MLENFTIWFEFVVLIAESLLFVLVGYLFILTVAAITAPSRTKFPDGYTPQSRFAILIPAHDEEKLLPNLLQSLHDQNYPDELFELFIVADNCSDRTAEIGREMQACVYERQNKDAIGKGYALNWLLRQIQKDRLEDDYTAFVIFDADTVVDQEFLRVMDARLQQGETVIQGYYSVRDPGRSSSVSLRYIAFAVLHYLRPMGRSLLKGTAGLKGNGMCFAAGVYKAYQWSGSVTEDIEYHMDLVLNGKQVTFAPDARLEAEMPGSFDSARTQNVRWESGRWEMVRRYALPLGKMAWREPSFIALDALMEHLIPPTSMLAFSLFGTAVIGFLFGWLGGTWITFWLSVLLLGFMALYLLAGLNLVKAPRSVWLALLSAPKYVFWKLGLLLRIGAGEGSDGWIRTER